MVQVSSEIQKLASVDKAQLSQEQSDKDNSLQFHEQQIISKQLLRLDSPNQAISVEQKSYENSDILSKTSMEIASLQTKDEKVIYI